MSNQDTPVEEWKGVTIEELRFMRASALIRLEMQKDYLKRKAVDTLPSGVMGKNGMVAGIAAKMSIAQKVMLAVKGIRLATNLITFFRRR